MKKAAPVPSICFVAQSAYGVLANRVDVQHIGGAEVQQVLLARGLQRRGYAVRFVVFDHGQPDGQDLDGIRTFKSYRPGSGIRGLRFFHPRLSGLWAAMRRADADFYFQRGAESETGLVARWCRGKRRRFVFSVAGHHMFLPDPPADVNRRECILYRYGMARADLILVQSEEQKTLLRQRFSLDASVLRNCCDPTVLRSVPSRSAEPGRRSGVLWVGRFAAVKRPDWCLNVAEELGDVSFTVVGMANPTSAPAVTFQHRATSLSNVTLAGYVPHAQMGKRYRTAALLLSTSVSEGFPNVFLEAWACGTPVVTTVDPDDIVRQYGLGRVAETPAALGAAIHELPVGSDAWKACSANCLAYVKQHHDPEIVVDRLDGYLSTIHPARGARNPLCVQPARDV